MNVNINQKQVKKKRTIIEIDEISLTNRYESFTNEEEERNSSKKESIARKKLSENCETTGEEEKQSQKKKIETNNQKVESQTENEKKKKERERKQEARKSQTSEERNEQKRKDKERRKKKRETQTEVEAKANKKKEKERKHNAKEALTKEEKKGKKEKDKERMKQQRESQTDEEKNEKKKKEMERKQKVEEALTKKENKEKKKINQVRMKQQRESQTEEEVNKNKKIEKERKKKAEEALTKQERKQKNEKARERMLKLRNRNSEFQRLKNFQASARYGPIFCCNSCEQKMFRNGVCELDNTLIEKLMAKNNETYNEVFKHGLKKVPLNVFDHENPKNEEPKAYLCFTCKRHLNQGRIPPMSCANGLGLVNLENDPDLILTELENNLIAKRILFQKIYQLPKSRMSGCKDKLINIPINDTDIINTFENLPRTPKEAGLFEVKLKRKMEYNNYHKKQYVNTEKLFKALNFLRLKEHPNYLFFDEINDYEKRCQENDPKGYNLLFVYEDGIEKIVDMDEYLEDLQKKDQVLSERSKFDLKENVEEDDKKKDPARKFQFDYAL